MDATQIQQLLRTRHNLRVGPHTAAYVAATIDANRSAKSIKVLAADARTGVPTPRKLDPASFRADGAQIPLFPT